MTGPAVGFVGAGSMGGPMVHRLLRDGVAVTVHVRRAEAAREFEAAGAATTGSLLDAVRGKSVVIVCVFDERQLEDVVLGPAGVAANLDRSSVLVVHTTTSPRIMQSIAELASSRGADVLDAPISGSALDIEEGRLTVLAGGRAEVVSEVEAVLKAYAAQYLRTGELGTASTVKLINNLLFTANVQLVAAATQMGSELGVDSQALLSAILHCSGASNAMERINLEPSVSAFAARVGKYLSKDATAALALADSLGAPSLLLRHVTSEGPLDLGVVSSHGQRVTQTAVGAARGPQRL